ncbi:VanZ family protein [Streptomyces sp. NPDC001970]
MIEASIGAVPGLLLFFLVASAVVSSLTILAAKARKKPPLIPTVLSVAVVGILAVTLLPSGAGIDTGQCDAGVPRHVLTSSSALLNIVLFVPASVLAVVLSRRPLTTAAAFVILSGGIEFFQAVLPVGRSCSLTDMTANSIGTLVGVGAATIWLKQNRRLLGRPFRDLSWGAVVGVLGVAALAGMFHSQVKAVNVVAMDDQRRAYVDSVDGSDQWIADAAEGVFGKGTVVEQTSAELEGSRSLITATTNRGTIAGWWPDRTLQQAWSSDDKGDTGTYDEVQALRVGNAYAAKWFPESLAGSKEKVRELGEGNDPTAPYMVSYRRYVNGVMMPMRLDITVTKAGRIMGFTSKPEKDPDLPKVTLEEDAAKRIASQMSGKKAISALLLAQKIGGQWWPVWLIGVNDADVFVDAVTGRSVTPDA